MPQCFEMMPQAAFRIPPCRFEARGGFFAPLADMVLTLTAPQVPLTALRLLESVLPSGTVRRIETAPALTLTWMRPEATLPFPKLETSAGPEAFAFTITPEGIAACAASAEGLFRLCAWLYRELSRGALPCGCGMDAPDKPIRGVMLDVSRNRIYSVQTLCNIIDLMALVGLNQLELYFENTFAYRDHATVWAHTSPYTPEDITVIAAYASARFVRLVPNQNTLGHFERWLKHPAYLQYAELPEGGARTPWGSIQQHPTGLYAADRKTRDFVKGLLTELLPCFPMADRVNLGGDEVFDLGQGRSATSDKAGLYLSYMREMADVAQRFGKQPELWADMLLRHPEMIPLAKTVLPEAIWVVWGYEATDPLEAYVARLQAAGLRVMVAPGTSSWRSFCGRTANMLANITAAAATPAEGLLLTDWGDAGHWQPFVVSLPAILFAAAKAWRMTAAPDLADWID
ncbi:MAG: family 20 glycosylhydrolase, partial [Kiritimatiellae bacterium]|nr:family 20 glycosylhydrolase [Kiritimatiellia bacterium]